MSKDNFFNIYCHGFARVGVGVPRCRIADPHFNARETLSLATQAAESGAVLIAFPELGLSAYTCDDLFRQQVLLEATLVAFQDVVSASRLLPITLVVGLPLRVNHQLYNCAAVVASGFIQGIVPKSFLPNYGEFYEARQFTPAANVDVINIDLFGQTVPFGPRLLFEISNVPNLRFHVEICEDLWVPIPPSSFAALAGATVLVNLSASNIVVGKATYRQQLVGQQSARCLSAYLYSSAGNGESTTDLAWDGQALIYENGERLAESGRFLEDSHLITADVDLDRLSHERMRTTTFGDSIHLHAAEVGRFRLLRFEIDVPRHDALPLQRNVERFPYVPAEQSQRNFRCEEVYHIQVQALVQRLASRARSKVILGVSGGLDSTHALLVCAKAMDKLGLPRSNILGFTMPGFATSTRTLQQAHELMLAIGCRAQEIDIRPSCMQMLKDIGHPFAEGVKQYDIAFENVQAGERTSHLFRLANHHGGMVIGTGNLSELALGWCTYGVGDHMSHYNVNASVPKTLISHLVRWVAETNQIGETGSQTLLNVLATDISPELIPGEVSDAPSQKTETTIGPYEIQDFNLYYLLRYGFRPSKIALLAHSAWSDRDAGRWPEGAHVVRNEYDLRLLKHYLEIFVDRFFRTSQFKRSCVPNSPKVGSGGSLSPRGDWRAPSDSQATVWLEEVRRIPD